MRKNPLQKPHYPACMLCKRFFFKKTGWENLLQKPIPACIFYYLMINFLVVTFLSVVTDTM
jgi:hypothetical protein